MSSYNFTLAELDRDMFCRGYFIQEDVCRFCWTKDATVEIYSKNVPNKDEKPLLDKIISCLTIDINTLSYPKRLCDSCANNIEMFYSFKMFCMDTHKKLEDVFRIPFFETEVKIERMTDSNEISLEKSSPKKDNCLEEVIENGKTQKEQKTADADPTRILNHNQNDLNSESDDLILVSSEIQICQENESISNNKDKFVDVGTVPNTVVIENSETIPQNIIIHRDEDIKSNYNDVIVENEKEVVSMDGLMIGACVEITTTEKRRSKRKVSRKVNDSKIVTAKPKHLIRLSGNEDTQPNALKEFCKTCGKDFRNIYELAEHNNKVHKLKDDGQNYVCFGCEKSFTNKKRRFNHELRYCKGLQDGYRCPKCSKYVQFRKILEKHIKYHKINKNIDLPEILFKCKTCKKAFKNRGKLENHKRTRHPVKDYVCETCGRVFKRPDYLYKHRQIHSDERDHKCPHCPYRTVQRTSLVIHIRRHTGERPFACDQCPQRFFTNSNLNVHKRRHAGTRKHRHQCQLCPKSYAYKTSLVYHTTHGHATHGQFICHHCHATYVTKLRLTRHIREHHVTDDMADNMNTAREDDLFQLNLPSILQNIDYGEFCNFENRHMKKFI